MLHFMCWMLGSVWVVFLMHERHGCGHMRGAWAEQAQGEGCKWHWGRQLHAFYCLTSLGCLERHYCVWVQKSAGA